MNYASVDDLPWPYREQAKERLAGKPRKNMVPNKPTPAPSKQSKYRNKPVRIDGIRFASQAEAAYYLELKDGKKAGHVDYFLMQVSMHLSAKKRYVVDFQVFLSTGEVQYIDVKGHETAEFKVKREWIEQKYPLVLHVVTRKDIPTRYFKQIKEVMEAAAE